MTLLLTKNILKLKFHCNFNRNYHVLNEGSIKKTNLTNKYHKPLYNNAIFRFQSSLISIPKENTLDSAVYEQNLKSSLLNHTIQDSDSLNFYSDLQNVINDTFVPLNKLGEPTLQTFGLGNKYTPVGWLQNTFECVHSNLELPWWSTISVCIIATRLLLLPIFINHERYCIKLQKCDSDVTKFNEKIKEVEKLGNKEEHEKLKADVVEYVHKHGIYPHKPFIPAICLTATHLIFLISIRNMIIAEVPSMVDGGIAWFHDLTDCDCILPIIACCLSIITLALTIDPTKIKYTTPSQRVLRNLLKFTPILLLPIMLNISAALTLYWAVNNSFTLCQTIILRLPMIRKLLKLPLK